MRRTERANGRWGMPWAFASLLLIWVAAPRLEADDDAPGRGVARLSVVSGDVSVRRGDSGDWVAARVNAPLVVEDRVLTGPGSRAEVQFDWANLIRLAGDSEIRLAELEHHRYLIQIVRGTVMFRVLRDSEAEVELSTPSVSVRPFRKGAYRISVRDEESEITVRSGEAEIFTPRGAERLRSGRTMLARGTRADPEYRIVDAIAYDSFDRWNEQRDRYLSRSRSYRYVHRSIYGVEDLDDYGDWHYVVPYGWVWTPRVVAGWYPYHFGRWIWVDWYGWTWLSYDPWGWAPFHYGRWFYHRPYGWCWWPGGIYVRQYWRPALVAFFGWGHKSLGFGFGFGFGRVCWVPLAPYEPFYPWYGPRYYRRFRHGFVDHSVTVVNNIDIVNVYRNARIRGAVVGLDASDFSRGDTRNLVRFNADEIRRASLVRGMLPVAPERESLRWVDREVTLPNLPRELPERRFFSRRQPVPVERIPFEEQRRSLEQIARRPEPGRRAEGIAGGVPLGEAPSEPIRRVPAEGIVRTPSERGEAGGWRVIGVPETDTAEGSGRGWRRLAETPREAALPRTFDRRERQEPGGREIALPRQPERDLRGEEGGWRRFGEGARRREAPAEMDAGGWRRFGEPIERPSRIPRGAERERRTGGDPADSPTWRGQEEPIRREAPQERWRRFEN
ncbi:MAG: FecR domain-containing protein, partial [Bryobacteraceae bacterium]|nr:FecR domain-containing protein [Bryobacteraceae bacterium]